MFNLRPLPLSKLGVQIMVVVVILAILVSGLSAAGTNLSQSSLAGNSFTYQGYLTDGGNAANGVYDFQFELYDAAASGAQVGSTLLVNDVSVGNGLFTVTLDFGNVFTGIALWLEIGVRPGADTGSYTLLIPRQALTAAPYALFATQAPWSGLQNMPAGFADGQDDDTTYTAGTGLALNGGVFSLDPDFALPQACSSGEIPEWNGSNWICGTDDTGGGTASWNLNGNAGTSPGSDFLGTSDNQPLELRVNGSRALLLQPNATSPNLLGGYAGNSTSVGVIGATIGGGGQAGATNQVTADFGTIGGGQGNVVTDTHGTVSGGSENAARGIYTTVSGGQYNSAINWNATVGGGYFNIADGLMATVGGGSSNDALGDYATVAGGVANDAHNFATTVGGGNDNDAIASGATIGGGQYNQATNFYATIGGGVNNSAGGVFSAIGGGDHTTALGEAATIGGGSQISVTADYGTVGGGQSNAVTNVYGTIGGGRWNTASASDATIGGGVYNTADSGSATVGGGASNNAIGYQATVSGGGSNYASGHSATISGGEQNTAFGALGTVGGGNLNHAYGDYSTVAGGNGSVVYSFASTIGGGTSHYITGTYSTIAGGRWNRIEAPLATIGGGGYYNPSDRNYVTDEGGTIAGGGSNYVGNGSTSTTDAYYATVGGGWNNTATTNYATIGGGDSNIVGGESATVPGGYSNDAIGNYSLAAGCNAQALHAGSFVWADSRTCTAFPSQRDYQFRVRAWGGAQFDDEAGSWVEMLYGTGLIHASNGAFLSWGGTWTNASDANLKENFTPVDGREVLEAVAALPIRTWNYKAEDESVRHLGPTAQDFQAAFALGDSDTAISTVDADGVALAAIQGLHQMIEEQGEQISELQAENEALSARLAKVEQAIQADSSAPGLTGDWLTWFPLMGLLGVGLIFGSRRMLGGGR